MFPKINPTTTPSWQALKASYNALQGTSMKSLFMDDERRFEKYAIYFEDILFDYSKNNFDSKTLELLLQLAKNANLKMR